MNPARIFIMCLAPVDLTWFPIKIKRVCAFDWDDISQAKRLLGCDVEEIRYFPIASDHVKDFTTHDMWEESMTFKELEDYWYDDEK